MTVKEINEFANPSAAAQALVKEDSTPATYLDSLEKQKLNQDALTFLAHKLAIDVGVKWASACIRELQSPELKEQKNEPLEACDQWIKAPSDPTRWAAKKAADNSKTRGPSKFLGMAVFFSGGSIAGAGAPETPPPKHAAQKMVLVSIQMAVVSYLPEKAEERYRRALAIGKALDSGAAIPPPAPSPRT